MLMQSRKKSWKSWKRGMQGLTGVAAALVVGGVATNPAAAQERDQIKIVGSSTVYPFSSYVAEEFGKRTRYSTPVVESTGSGGGHKLFGAGVGYDTPDLTNSSRKMKASEFKRAQSNGVKGITEAVIGYDGIALAQSVDADPFEVTLEQIHLAVAAEVPNPDGSGLIDNPYEQWSDIDASLPDREIRVYGPPTTSGTRDAFEELVMEAASEEMPAYGGEYTKIRADGAWVDAGENDNLIVQKIDQDPAALGVFGYSFLEENRDKVAGLTVDGVEPRPETISSGEYPISRSLFFYIKHAHVGKVPGLMEYVGLFMSEGMIGKDGQLKKIGLIPLPDHLRDASRKRVMNLTPLRLDDGKLTTLEGYAAEHHGSKSKAY